VWQSTLGRVAHIERGQRSHQVDGEFGLGIGHGHHYVRLGCGAAGTRAPRGVWFTDWTTADKEDAAMTAKVPEEFRELLDAPVATLATIGQDGWPQVTAVAFIHDKDDDLVKVSLNDTRQKTKNLQRDPHTTLFILDPATPYRTLEIRARAELVPDPEFVFAKVAGAKYGADFHDRDLPGETRSIVTLHPIKVNATDLT
jgi:PPOX class probable F420-dependent enzyme